MQGERILVVFSALQGRGGTFSDAFLYDVVFTDRRLFLIALVRWGGGLVSAAVFQAMQLDLRKKARSYEVGGLESLVAAGKGSLSIPYADVHKAKIRGMLGKDLYFKGGGRWVTVSIPKADQESFSQYARQWLRADVR